MKDQLNSVDGAKLSIGMASGMDEKCGVEGVYTVKCFEKEGGALLWEDKFDNVVTYVGQNLMLSSSLQGSGYTDTGPYMGLISSVSWSATSVNDTMSSHAGWTEAGTTNAPTFAARVTPAFSAPSSGVIQTSSAVSFTMTGSGTLEGAFIVFGTGAVATILDTNGTLLSAGAFAGGAQPVNSGNVVQVTYSLTL
jgi:hypothetical protein